MSLLPKKSLFRNTIIKASLWNFVGTFLLKSIAYISVPIFTRILDQSDYGYISTYTTYISLIGIIVGFGLNTATVNARIDFEGRFDDYNGSILRASLVVFIVELFIAQLTFRCIENILHINRLHLNLVFIIAYSEFVINTYYKINTVDYQFKKNLKVSLTNALISLVLAIVLIKLMKNSITAKLIGQGLFAFVIAIVLFARIAIVKCKRFTLSDIKYASVIAIPNVFHQVSQVIMGQSDRMIILGISGAAASAKYSVVYNFGLILQVIWNAINEVWVPWLYRRLHEKQHETIIKISRIYLYIFTLATVLMMLIAPDLLIVIAPRSYQDAKPIIEPIILATYFVFMYSFFANIEIFHRKNRFMAIFTMVAAVVNIIGNLVFIPVYGYGAAAYTTLFSYFLLMILHYVLATFIIKVSFYPLRLFLLPIVIALVSTVVSLLFLENCIMRYSLVLALIAGGGRWTYRNKTHISEFIDSFRM